MGCDSGSVVRRLGFSWVLLLDSDGTLRNLTCAVMRESSLCSDRTSFC